ncbi:proteasome activator pa28, REG alpha/beta subunit [Daedalea quercina L-15889]|uniref:Proteasome activator pa28, REG alpha/beta subunit n=1 Tax=Daedalea quercina L-15889 TaxID=1314783 RepID=A0A165UI19_9APHY|nr:proteasome activator pa28, REG alpha/beta subunit [Daedalea quercina L-15889]
MPGKKNMEKETANKIEEFQAAAVAAAEDVVFRGFPGKILELQQLIDSTNDESSPFHISHAATSTDPTVHPPPFVEEGPDVKKRKLHSSDTNGVVTTGLTLSNDVRHAVYPNLVTANQHIDKVHGIVKKECEQLADLCDKVKLWVNLSMPKIEDGDNFGVQIQEEVLTELHRSQESAYNIRDAGRTDHLNRAKICSKIVKYPHLEDYALALKEHDEKQLYVARQNLYDLRNVYAILTDILHKNIAKIRAPKGNNLSGMY